MRWRWDLALKRHPAKNLLRICAEASACRGTSSRLSKAAMITHSVVCSFRITLQGPSPLKTNRRITCALWRTKLRRALEQSCRRDQEHRDPRPRIHRERQTLGPRQTRRPSRRVYISTVPWGRTRAAHLRQLTADRKHTASHLNLKGRHIPNLSAEVLEADECVSNHLEVRDESGDRGIDFFWVPSSEILARLARLGAVQEEAEVDLVIPGVGVFPSEGGEWNGWQLWVLRARCRGRWKRRGDCVAVS
ncbi:unnamed protein product [Mycena citricolor]|uniref:Uncharacterized protein n=1 Tax=Mycena citricolor TaxID=2018698 RepID=A0AAD2K3G0_9AGAR|nr:unnamed protein product [Mycena citricolor]